MVRTVAGRHLHLFSGGPGRQVCPGGHAFIALLIFGGWWAYGGDVETADHQRRRGARDCPTVLGCPHGGS